MRAMSIESTRAANGGVDTYQCKSCGKKIKVGFWGWLIGKKDYYASKPYVCPSCLECFPWKKV